MHLSLVSNDCIYIGLHFKELATRPLLPVGATNHYQNKNRLALKTIVIFQPL